MDRLLDCSKHGYVLRDGRVLSAPPRLQQIDAMGRFLGMATDAASLTAAEDAQLTTQITRVGAALHHAGYFGPFCIDAFRYRTADGDAFNPRCEINARFTMGYPRALLLNALRLDARAFTP